MVKVWDKKGKSFFVHSVDARELIQQGEHFAYNPKKPRDEQDVTSFDKYKDDQDISKLSRDELIEFALEKFNSKLSVRFGESRLMDEITKLRKEKKLKEEVAPIVEDEEDEEDEEEID